METITMSIAEQNAEIIRRGYEAFNQGDVQTLSTLFHENASWHTPGHTFVGGSRTGLKEVLSQFGRYGSETHGSFRALLTDVAASEDGRVAAIHRNTGERNGKKLDAACIILFELSNGKVISGREYFFDLYAWDAFWS